MRTSTCLLPNVLFAIALGLAQFAGHQSSAHAQEDGVIPASYQSGTFFSRELGTPLRFGYHTEGYGTQEGVFSLGGMKVFNMEGATFFLDGQGTLSDDFGGGFNLGVGYRQLATLGNRVDSDRIIGAGFWTDGQSSVNDNFFTQLGFSLESLGDVYDVRLNGSFPLTREKFGDGTLTAAGEQFFSGNNLFGAQETFGVDTALDVLDGEVAVRVADLEAWGFAGAYYLGGGEDDTGGYRLGVRGYAVPDVSVSFEVTDDDIYDTNFRFGITWFIGRTHKGNAPCGTLLDRFREPVLRNDYIAMTSREETRVSGDALLIQGTDDPVSIVHVDSTAADGGDGTFENPYNELSDANGAGSAVNDIILGHGGSMFSGTSGQITLQENQRLLGEGVDQDGSTVTHFVQTNIGIVSLPETAAGAQALDRPVIDGTGAAAGTAMITLADGSVVDNFTITDAEIGISANAVTVPTGDTISNVQIQSSQTGISLTDMMGSTVINSNVLIEGSSTAGLVVDGGDESVTMNGQINDSTGNSLIVRNRTGGTVSFAGTIDDDLAAANTSMGVLIEDNTDATVSFDSAAVLDIHVDGAGVDGMLVQNNTNTSVSVPGAADVTATGDANGVRFEGNDADSTLTFSDLNATAANGNTVSVIGPGTVTVSSDTSTDPDRGIANTGTGTAFFNDGAGGSAIVTVNSNIMNSTGGSAVTINNRAEANNITFTGTVDAENAAGIVADNNTDGTILFTNTLTLNTATANAVELTNNTGATISFSDLDIDTTDGSGFLASGGGTLIVTSANGTNNIDVTGAGVGVSLDGMTIDTAGVTFDVVNVGGGAGVGINLVDLDGDGQVVIGGGTDAPDGGLLTTAGTAINVDNANNVAITNVRISNAGTAQGVVVNNQATGSQATFAGLEVNTADGDAVTVGEASPALGNVDGTITFTDLMATTTGDGDGIVVSNDDTSTTTITFTDVAVDIQDTDANTDVAKGFVASGGGTIVMNGTNTIDSAADTAFEATGVRNLSASNVTIDNTLAQGVVVQGQDTAGDSVTLTNFNVTTSDADAVTIGNALLADGNSEGTVILDNLTAEATGTGNAVVVDNNTGATVSFNALTATTDSGTGFTATNGGTLIATGTNNVTANTGAGVDIQGMTIDAAGVGFANVDVTNGTSGVNLDTLTGGTVTVSNGTMTTSGTAVSINDVDNAAISGVTIDNTTGAGVQVTGQDSATDSVALTNLDVTTTTADAVTVTNNTDGTVAISGLTAESSDGDTVALTNNTGATVNMTSMTVEAIGSGTAFTATGGGTLSTTGTNNVTANTGAGVDIQGMTIAAGNVAFANVDVTNGTSGVNLDTLTGGTVTVGGGTMTTSGTAVTVNDVDNAAINNVTINNAGGSGLVATNSAGDTLTVSNLDVTTGAGEGVNVTGGTFSATGTNTITTSTGTGLTLGSTTIGAAGASFNSVDVTGATNGIMLTDTTGGLIRVGSAAATGTDGNGGTLDTTGTAIVVSGVTNAVFNDVTTITDAGFNGANVTHTSAANSSVIFDNLTHSASGAGDAVVLTDDGTGEIDFTLRNSSLTVTGTGQGFNLITNANTGEIDVRLTNNVISAADGSAVNADINAGTGNIQFLVSGGNDWTNNNAANATANFIVNTDRTLNATIGDQDGTAPFDENRFVNSNAGGTALAVESNSAAANVNLDLRGNNGSGGTNDYLLTETLGTFGIVDLTETVTNNSNNANTVTLGGGGVEGDFDDLGAVDQVD